MHAIYGYSILQSHGIYIALIFQNDELTLQKKIKIYEPKNLFYIQKYQTRVDEIVHVVVVDFLLLCTDLNSMDNDPNSSFDS